MANNANQNLQELTENFHNSIMNIAESYRTAYCHAVVNKPYRRLLIIIGLLLLTIALIGNFKPLMAISIVIFLYGLRKSFMSKELFHVVSPKRCSEEYFQIQKKISELVDFPKDLRIFNEKINNESFVIAKLYQSEDESENDFVVLVKVSTQVFPVCLITDRVCREYFVREIDEPETDFNFVLDLALEELKQENILLRYWNDATEGFKIEQISEEETNNLYYGINYFNLQIIYR